MFTSLVFEEKKPMGNGQEMTTLSLTLNMTRKSHFYLWKVIAPLYMLMVSGATRQLNPGPAPQR